LSIKDQLKIIGYFKTSRAMMPVEHSEFKPAVANLLEDPYGLISRVTGEKNEDGKPGVAGWKEEMRWHANQCWGADRLPIIWLYAVKGTKGSRTTYNNTILAYNDLDLNTQQEINDYKLVLKRGMSNHINEDGEWGEKSGTPIYDFTPNLVQTNIAGRIGLYLPFLNVHQILGKTVEETSKIIRPLGEFVIQEKYCYDHDWSDGDIVIAEQWLSIHKRWEFQEIESRMLHRIALDFPEQNYLM